MKKIPLILLFVVLFFSSNAQENTFSLSDTNVEVGRVYYLNVTFYSIRLDIESSLSLDSLVNFMNNNNCKFEIQSHTNYTDTDSRNLQLSKFYANSVKDYLVASGIEHTRIIAKGYGESQPFIVTKEIHKEYPFLPIGQELNEEFINTLERGGKKFNICLSLNARIVIKILEKND